MYTSVKEARRQLLEFTDSQRNVSPVADEALANALREASEWKAKFLQEQLDKAIVYERLHVSKRVGRERRRALKAVVNIFTSDGVDESYVEKPSQLCWDGDHVIARVALKIVNDLYRYCDKVPNDIYDLYKDNEEVTPGEAFREILSEIKFALEVKSSNTAVPTGRTLERVNRGMEYFVKYFDSLWV